MTARKPFYVREIDRVFSDGVVTVTTNGHSAIVTTGVADGASPFPEKMAQLVSSATAFTGAPLADAIRRGFFELPVCAECVSDQPRDCPRCRGSKTGVHFCEDCGDEHECVCDRCGGDGVIACPVCDRAFVASVDGAAFDLRLVGYTLAQMKELPLFGGVLREGDGKVLVLRGESSTALVMNMSAGDDEIRKVLALTVTP